MACRPAPWAPISAARSGTAAVWIERSTRRWWSPRSARLWLCDSVRRVTRCGASTEGRAAMASGVRTAYGVPSSTLGSDHRSSVGHSRGGSSDRLAVGGHRGRRGCGCDSVRRVTRCGASTEGRAGMASGVRTAHGVPASTLGSDQRSSVGHSRGVDRAIDSPLVVAAVGAAVAATLCDE
jgi:hypothetical protein